MAQEPRHRMEREGAAHAVRPGSGLVARWAAMLLCALLGAFGMQSMSRADTTVAPSSVQVAAIMTTQDKPAGSDGWALLPAGSKVWIDAACRSTLTSAGTPTQVFDWSVIAATPDAAPLACAAFSMNGTVPIPAYHPTPVAIVATADKPAGSDGWALLPAGGKVWIDAACRTALSAAGITTRTTEWSAIAAVKDQPGIPCSGLMPVAGSGSPVLIFPPDKVAAGSDGWVLFPDGTAQWVSAACRTQLLGGGMEVVIGPWSQISTITPRSPAVPCDEVIPVPTTVQVLAQGVVTPAAGGTITAGNGVTLSVPAGAVTASTTSYIAAMSDGSYDVHIDGAWSGKVDVTVPLASADDAVVHNVGGSWLTETAAGVSTATVSTLSLFGTVKKKAAAAVCLLNLGSAAVLRCLVQKGITYVDNQLAKWIAEKISDSCLSQIIAGAVTSANPYVGALLAAFQGACVPKLDPGTLPPSTAAPTTAAPSSAPPATVPATQAPVTAAPATNAPAPSSPTVTLRKGATVRTSSCSSSYCATMAVSTSGIGASATVRCFANGSQFYVYSTSNGSFSSCYYGYRGGSVYVTVNGVRSNTVVW